MRRKFYSSKEDDIDEIEENNNENFSNPQLKREEQELSKISTGIGRVFLKTVKEREKVMAYRKINLDPRKSSRTPSAKVEMASKLRYDNPTHACKRTLDICSKLV
jgi:actin-binding LIM protein